ncbi:MULTISPECIES: hypothetical protein [unclassified Sphingomonas]|uniref:hypothetical protein n=1 Tax=unclassified Sphingomonas TaxID=196159 RepID=UPI001F587E79|nr:MULTISPECIES: hypothetical protein [unclassified Sphingomonas]
MTLGPVSRSSSPRALVAISSRTFVLTERATFPTLPGRFFQSIKLADHWPAKHDVNVVAAQFSPGLILERASLDEDVCVRKNDEGGLVDDTAAILSERQLTF